jgi:hypothetical protein
VAGDTCLPRCLPLRYLPEGGVCTVCSVLCNLDGSFAESPLLSARDGAFGSLMD